MLEQKKKLLTFPLICFLIVLGGIPAVAEELNQNCNPLYGWTKPFDNEKGKLPSHVKYGYRYNKIIMYPSKDFEKGMGISEKPAKTTVKRRVLGPYPDTLITNAPVVTSPGGLCGRHSNIALEGEYVLFFNHGNPRVVGDICKAKPTFKFDTHDHKTWRRPITNALKGIDLRQLINSEIYDGVVLKMSDIKNGRVKAISKKKGAEHFHVETTLIWIFQLISAQCGRLPNEVIIQIQEQNQNLAKEKILAFDRIYEGKLSKVNEGYSLETVVLSELGAQRFEDEYAARYR